MRQATAIMAALALSAGAASAQQFTAVHAPPGTEKSHAQILSSALGGTFNASGARDYSNGSILADRNRDSGGVHDQVWQPGRYTLTMVAREAGYTHTFGYVRGGAQNLHTFEGLLRSDEIGSSVSVDIGTAFRWAIQNDEAFGGHLFTSRDKDNPSDFDHMTSYQLLRGGNLFGYALFFEDLKKHHSDKDYNDVAVILTLVPTPQAAMMGLTGLGGLGLLAGRRRRETM